MKRAVLNNERLWHVETTDVLDGLRSLPDRCVQCVCTSPPYWGLRDYGTPPSIWGGSSSCDHDWQKHVQPAANGIIHEGGMSGETLSSTSATRKPKVSAFCRCGAWRGCYGLEPTPELFVANTVAIFREVRRVLRDDGTLWLNIGDSWNAYNGGAGPGGWNDARDSERPALETGYGLRCKSLKPKDLCGIPWRVALALQDDGWYLRQDIIWAKPNGMPESVRDRCTKSHEYIFLLTKSERYFYDRMAIAEPVKPVSVARAGRAVAPDNKNVNGAPGQVPHKLHAPRSAVKFGGTKHTEEGQTRLASGNEWECDAESQANRRSVWTIPVGGYREAHFATFPPALPETCLKAGTSSKGCCAQCGAPWRRVTESERVPTRPGDGSKVHGANSRINKSRDPAHASEHDGKKKTKLRQTAAHRDDINPDINWRNSTLNSEVVGNRDPQRHVTQTVTTGWAPGCDCNAELWPCLTLDPFNGAGTTGLVAAKGLGLRYIGLELNPEYADMSRRRIEKGFCEPAPKVEPAKGQQELFA